MGPKKHKKHKEHKSARRERYEGPLDKPPGLKLILKVGSSSTPEYSNEWPFPAQNAGGTPLYSVAGTQDEESYQSAGSASQFLTPRSSHHKKSKKKKKKKDKGKDREKKHRHHHKEKKRKREESSQDEVSLGEETMQETIGIGSPTNREPRTCVLRQRQERIPLQRMLDKLVEALEKRDPQQFFAWPVTDNIAPGYSHIITKPMDFSTMKQKIDDNLYANLQDLVNDFKLMCTNAMEYNHTDTIYYKASKKLLHAGLKILQADKLGWLLNYIPELTSAELGFEITADLNRHQEHMDEDTEDLDALPLVRKMPATKFEAVPDELSPDEILAQCQAAAKDARSKLSARRIAPTMGFLRQKKDGTTTLNILVGGDGVIPGTKKRPVLLGALTGKINDGTGQIQGFREDRRNVVKPVKPLYYGAFGSYAPSYDSAFANLTKEESDLVYQTYGSDTAVQYAESILDFAKDCDYTVSLVDSLLDLLTGGDHGKTKKVLDEKRRLREEEETIKTILESKTAADSVKIDIDALKTLSSVGINVDFLSTMEADIKSSEEQRLLQDRLDTTSQLLEKLQQVQNERLSMPLPQHLSNLPAPTEQELTLADNITDNLTDMAKRVNPLDVINVTSLRKAMGVSIPEEAAAPSPPQPPQQQQQQAPSTAAAQQTQGQLAAPDTSAPMDLESELRQFLESEPSLAHSPLRDDKTIEEILME